MTVSDAEVAVVGAGLVGSAVAWALARRGAQVALLEQFTPANPWGASHGRARIFRMAYPDPLYVRLAQAALPLWRELERVTGVDVLTLTGAVDHGERTALDALAAALQAVGEECERLTPALAQARWPGLAFDRDVLHHPRAGRLDAEAAVHALVAAGRSCGVDDRMSVTVERLEVRGTDDVRLHLANGGVVRARHVVVAAGAWTARLLADVPGVTLPRLRVTQEQPALFAPVQAPWPSFIHHLAPAPGDPQGGIGIYGLGGTEGVKIGHHGVGREVDAADRQVDVQVVDDAELASLVAYATRWLPGVDVHRVSAQTCTYTSTVDGDFAIGRAGAVTVAAGFSGHGFKFGPVLGELVAGHVLGVPSVADGDVPTDVQAEAAQRFSLDRPRRTVGH